MKKMLLLLSLGGMLFAARYPIIAEYNFLKGCIKSDKLQDYCICALSAIEDKYTLNEFITASQDKQKAKKMISYAVDKCIVKVK
jgi:hypothetical protein